MGITLKSGWLEFHNVVMRGLISQELQMTSTVRGKAECAVIVAGLTIRDDGSRGHSRDYALQDINVQIPRHGKTMILGSQCAGKSVLYEALVNAKSHPDNIKVNVPLRELPLHDRNADYQKKYGPIVKAEDFIVADEPVDQAYGFLLSLPNSMLVLGGQDGHQFVNCFDFVAGLSDGKILFFGTSGDFWKWLKNARPADLRELFPKDQIESEGNDLDL